MNAEEIAVGWWSGDQRYPRSAFYAYAYPAAAGFADATLTLSADHWNADLGEYILDWDDVRAADDPHGTALAFARSAVQHACKVCEWAAPLAACATGRRSPIV